MRVEKKADNAFDEFEGAEMKKHWKVEDVSTGGATMKMAGKGCTKPSYDNIVGCC